MKKKYDPILVENFILYKELKEKLDRLNARFEWYIVAAIFGGWAFSLFIRWIFN